MEKYLLESNKAALYLEELEEEEYINQAKKKIRMRNIKKQQI